MNLSIELDNFVLNFKVLDTPLAELWVNRMMLRDQYPLDDSKRFYGFNTQAQEERIALDKINHCIGLIQSQYPDVDRNLVGSVYDQDRLNYWHSVFETYHGLLGKEDRTDPLTPVLADLNVAVHRCESVARGNRPRFVCTWYGLPKTEILPTHIIEQYGLLNPKFGTVCLNYAEIGKTLEDLTQDNDNYISDEAFIPFLHYSADFNVRFYEESNRDVEHKIFKMREYYNQHIKFFHAKGYNSYRDTMLQPYRFPVAELIETMPRTELLTTISQKQHITKVTLI